MSGAAARRIEAEAARELAIMDAHAQEVADHLATERAASASRRYANPSAAGTSMAAASTTSEAGCAGAASSHLRPPLATDAGITPMMERLNIVFDEGVLPDDVKKFKPHAMVEAADRNLKDFNLKKDRDQSSGCPAPVIVWCPLFKDNYFHQDPRRADAEELQSLIPEPTPAPREGASANELRKSVAELQGEVGKLRSILSRVLDPRQAPKPSPAFSVPSAALSSMMTQLGYPELHVDHKPNDGERLPAAIPGVEQTRGTRGSSTHARRCAPLVPTVPVDVVEIDTSPEAPTVASQLTQQFEVMVVGHEGGKEKLYSPMWQWTKKERQKAKFVGSDAFSRRCKIYLYIRACLAENPGEIKLSYDALRKKVDKELLVDHLRVANREAGGKLGWFELAVAESRRWVQQT